MTGRDGVVSRPSGGNLAEIAESLAHSRGPERRLRDASPTRPGRGPGAGACQGGEPPVESVAVGVDSTLERSEAARPHSRGTAGVLADAGENVRVVDLFCGAGGLSVGLRMAGSYETVLAADKVAPAVQTYGLNFDHEASVTTLGWETELPEADVIVGGPPCQGFSSAGRRSPGDARNSLVAVFAHLIARHRPRAFLFENVEGFLTGDRGRWVVDLLDPLVRAGYCIHLRKINAAHFGVPQHRKRVVAIGGLGWDPGFPSPTHSATGMPGSELVGRGLPPCPTVLEALAGLPAAVPRVRGRVHPLDHEYRPPGEADLARIRALGPGQTMKDLPEHLWHETFRKRAYRRVKDGTPTERRGGAPAGLRRLDGRKPSKAITSGATSEFIHPTEDRPLTLRECARLQTFPDGFRFTGTLSQKALLIGNAIPPRLGEVLGLHIRTALLGGLAEASTPGVKSFVATHASAMSPALRRMTETVEQRFFVRRSAQLSLLSTKAKEPPQMALSQSQLTMIEKARNVGSSEMAVPLADSACAYLVARIVHDLGVHDQYPDLPAVIAPFFETSPVESLGLEGVDFMGAAAAVFTTTQNADTYFSCLAALLKARLKFERILQRQPFPTMDQVGPRGLLQYGTLTAPALAALLFWRKWLYDLDNRAAQETGYLFEPILAAAIGGAPASGKKSPVKRSGDATKSRQVDCLKGKKAYEFKLRITIASSGQGRWGEELQFPVDCVNSGFCPVLIVLDPTENPKLTELVKAFKDAGGETYVGAAAWEMLEKEAGPAMTQFLERYVRLPLDSLLTQAAQELPDLLVARDGDNVVFKLGDESITIDRHEDPDYAAEPDAMPNDAEDSLPGL